MSVNNWNDLLVEEVRDIYHAEKQVAKALPKMVKAAASDDLRHALEGHLEETHAQVERLEKVLQLLNTPIRGKKCEAMEGLIKEGDEVLQEDLPDTIRDAALTMAARKVEHYEIAAYSSAHAIAETLGLDEVASLLADNLAEEEAAEEKLTELRDGLLEVSADDEDIDAVEEEEQEPEEIKEAR
jgi:ferritin-like metal-binding protein YciE